MVVHNQLRWNGEWLREMDTVVGYSFIHYHIYNILLLLLLQLSPTSLVSFKLSLITTTSSIN